MQFQNVPSPLIPASNLLYWLIFPGMDTTLLFQGLVHLWCKVGWFYIPNLNEFCKDPLLLEINEKCLVMKLHVHLIVEWKEQQDIPVLFFMDIQRGVLWSSFNIQKTPFHLDPRPLRLWKPFSKPSTQAVIWRTFLERNQKALFYLWNTFIECMYRKKDMEALWKEIQPEIQNVVDTVQKTCDFRNLLNVFVSVSASPKAKPVDAIVWSSYTGDWVQVLAGPLSIGLVEQFGTSNTAQYTQLDDTTIAIKNSQTTICGKENTIQGTGEIKGPGQLLVRFEGQERTADYWVLALGPLLLGQYQWAIVSDPLRVSLFVLARNRLAFQLLYKTACLQKCEELGFSYLWNVPVETV